ncbi:MAG TPA: hypothetical protein VMD59_18985 [Acidimicrobiales bacterium]|nr:hypothetical protein [Acidimicrobiales bacterium]
MPRRARTRAALSAAATLATAAVLTGCGSSGSPSPGPARGAINLIDGTYAGLQLGASINSLHRHFGPPLPTNNNPYYTPSQAPPFLPADDIYDDVYPDVNITFAEARVASMTVYGLGASTGRGVGIGDALSNVARAYAGHVVCRPGRGGLNPEAPGCQVHVSPGVYAYFGSNPIKLIALSDHTMMP